jgi:hypothetical protein
MLFTFIYFVASALIAYLAFTSMFRNMRQINQLKQKPPTPTHPELLDAQGKPITEPLLVVNFVEPPDEVRRRLEEIYNKSQDAPER